MEDSGWTTLTSELIQQNYVFVASFSMILWDYVITLRQEVTHIWRCPRGMTKYLFLFCRYYTIGYFLACSIFGTQWTLQHPTLRADCRTWFLIHVASISIILFASQLILIRKVFNLYGKSTLLASGLFALHLIQGAGSFVLSVHISHSLNFNAICNGRNVPGTVLFIVASITCNQGITWALILRKVRPRFFPGWRRYLPTSDTHARMSWGLCLVAILIGTSHSFANQTVTPAYVFTFPIVLLTIGTCRYLLLIEEDRQIRAQLVEIIDTVEGMEGEQSISKKGLPESALTIQDRHRQSFLPTVEMQLPPSDLSVPSIRVADPWAARHDLDAVVANYPYLNGAESYKLKRDRRNMATDYSPQSSFDSGSQLASVHTPHRSLSLKDSEDIPIPDVWSQNSLGGEIQSRSDIEIGSLRSSSSVNSEDLRQFESDTWNVGPFMVMGGPGHSRALSVVSERMRQH